MVDSGGIVDFILKPFFKIEDLDLVGTKARIWPPWRMDSTRIGLYLEIVDSLVGLDRSRVFLTKLVFPH